MRRRRLESNLANQARLREQELLENQTVLVKVEELIALLKGK
jgi:hypothetical protein